MQTSLSFLEDLRSLILELRPIFLWTEALEADAPQWAKAPGWTQVQEDEQNI